MPNLLFEPASNQAAADFIKSKPAVSRAVFERLLPELRARAFFISGVEVAGVVQGVRDRLAELPAGGDWEEIKRGIVEDLHPCLAAADDPENTVAAERRAELLLRTHGFQAYAQAAYEGMVSNTDVFPSWQYLTMGDGRVRPTHAALNHLVLPANHEFWRTHFPPWDFGCRCQLVPLSEADVADLKEADKNKPRDQRQVLDEAAQNELTTTRRLVRNGVAHNLSAPSESGKPGAYQWHPENPSLSLDTLRQRYDAPTFGAFEQWARATQIPGPKKSVWQWASEQQQGASGGTVPTSTPAPPAAPAPSAAPAASAPSSTPPPPVPPASNPPEPSAASTPAAVIASLLRRAGLEGKKVWTQKDVAALLSALRKGHAVKGGDKLSSIGGPGLKTVGLLSKTGIENTLSDLFALLPAKLLTDLPKFKLHVDDGSRMGTATLGSYSKKARTMRLNAAALKLRTAAEARSDIWHETVHWLHEHGPAWWRESILAHFAERTAGEPMWQLPGVQEKDMFGHLRPARFKQDKWFDRYAGRVYLDEGFNPEGTEVATMHLQLLANPERLAKKMKNDVPINGTAFLDTMKIALAIFEE